MPLLAVFVLLLTLLLPEKDSLFCALDDALSSSLCVMRLKGFVSIRVLRGATAGGGEGVTVEACV